MLLLNLYQNQEELGSLYIDFSVRNYEKAQWTPFNDCTFFDLDKQ